MKRSFWLRWLIYKLTDETGGGGKSTSQQQSGPTPEQQATQKFALENVLKPLATELVPQIVESLRTGGVGARLPIARQGVEAARAASSRAVTGTEESLATSGLANTPFAESILGLVRQKGEQTTAAVPINIAQSFSDLASSLITGGGAISIGGPGISSGESKGLQFGLRG